MKVHSEQSIARLLTVSCDGVPLDKCIFADTAHGVAVTIDVERRTSALHLGVIKLHLTPHAESMFAAASPDTVPLLIQALLTRR
jgi:hypothetical protein